jgi:CDP-paratose 2-epimerase
MARQVRDVLFIDDLLDANEAAFRRADEVFARTYNISGGLGNALSLLELVEFLENRRGREPVCRFVDWRPGDQEIFISDVHCANAE